MRLKTSSSNVFSGIFLQCFTVVLLPLLFLRRIICTAVYLNLKLMRPVGSWTCCLDMRRLYNSSHPYRQYSPETRDGCTIFSSLLSVQSWNKRWLYNSSHVYRQYSPKARETVTVLWILCILGSGFITVFIVNQNSLFTANQYKKRFVRSFYNRSRLNVVAQW